MAWEDDLIRTEALSVSDRRDIDTIIESVRENYPNVCVQQLKVKFPADDDGIWYFWDSEYPEDEIQIENSFGQCPFVVETNRNATAVRGETVEQVVSIICGHLRTRLDNAKE
ncbi:MAG TPA: hypothetical protein VLI65_11165 [Pyrinomonadaceae bacterium]|jgi:hypothetical protein|nr:hypothetical protein [Pyrinomonadaceae bacterium]